MIGGLLTGIVLMWIVPVLVSNSMGRPKNREGALYGLFLGWIGVIILALLPPLPNFSAARCPWCAEEINPKAIVCKHCGRELDPIEEACA